MKWTKIPGGYASKCGKFEIDRDGRYWNLVSIDDNNTASFVDYYGYLADAKAIAEELAKNPKALG